MPKALHARRSDPPPHPAPAAAHHTILALELTGGFMKGARFEFEDGLNCIIGGRGTGKTTMLEFVRFVLGMMPDVRTSPARAKELAALLQQNLGAGGRVRLEVQTKHGTVYITERSLQEEAPAVFDEEGQPLDISLDRDLTFKADIYSQNEIEEIATNPSFQLALIDKFVEEDMRRLDAEIRKIERDLAQNGGELLRLDREQRELAETAADAKTLEAKLKALQATSGGQDAKILNAAHAARALRDKERKTIEQLVGDVRKVKADFDSLVATSARRLGQRIDADVSTGPNEEVFAAIAAQVHELTTLLERGATRIGKACDDAENTIATKERLLAQRHAKQDAEYRSLVEKSKEEAGKAAERARIQREYLEATTAKKEADARARDRKAREDERRRLASKLATLRNRRFLLRKGVADRLTRDLAPTIRVSIKESGRRDAFEALLTEGLKGSGMKYAPLVGRIVSAMPPDEFAALVRQGDVARLAEGIGLDPERTRKVVELLQSTELIYRIETTELEDLPRIELLDGDYKGAADLSTGQRCTTILPILLLESERPLLIDQPEDNLDNKFIYETVVKSVKGAKGGRQLIFVTHNPNIPVLGDAERVFALASDGRQGVVTHEGSVDEVKGEIETLLEGGKEAFLLRKRRYGH
jgi:ABC-type lipoprotein export system ATPase subunit